MSMQTRLLLAIGYVLLLAIVAFEVPLAVSNANRIDSEVRAQASAQIGLLSVAAAEELNEGPAHIDPLVEVTAETVTGRVVVVNDRGLLVSDSEGERRGTDFSNRPEIAEALAGRTVQNERQSKTLDREILATAAPVRIGDGIAGAVRITQSTAAESRAFWDSLAGLVLIGLIVLTIGLAAGVVVARQLAAPIEGLTGSARRIAGGAADERAPVSGSSEQRDLARSFNEMTDRLQAALRSQREFVADASHQLRTPLTGLRLRLEEAEQALLSERGGEDDARRELAAATAEFDRLSTVIDEMLVLSRLGESQHPPEPVPTGSAAADAMLRWRPEAEQHGIELSSTGDGDVVSCPRGDLDRVLDALVENALLYSPPGTAVEIAATGDRIEVRDGGPGLGAEAEAVFERFHRGSAGRAGPAGSGLGLPIARGLARAWGGDVDLRDRPDGDGAIATVHFAGGGRPETSGSPSEREGALR